VLISSAPGVLLSPVRLPPPHERPFATHPARTEPAALHAAANPSSRGAGPRICIGMAFAMMEATAMLATLLQHARFEAVEDHEPAPVARITLVPKGGMPLKVWTT
jgi:cytochrome P450